MAASDCFELMIDGPDVHCPKCSKPLLAWGWGDQILYTCCGCDVLGFNVEKAEIEMEDHKVVEIVEGAECKGCSKILEKRQADDVEFYTCSDCNVGLFANVKEISGIRVDIDDPGSCANHKEMRQLVGNAYDNLIGKLR